MSDQTDPNTAQVTSPPETVPATESVTQDTQDTSADAEAAKAKLYEGWVPKPRLDEVIQERNELRAWKAGQAQAQKPATDPYAALVARELGLPEDQAAKLARVTDQIVSARLTAMQMAQTRKELMADPQYAELQPKVDARFNALSPESQAAVVGNPELAKVLYDSVKSELIPAATRQGIQQGQQIAQASQVAKAAIPHVPTSGGASATGALTRERIKNMTPDEIEAKSAEIREAVLSGRLVTAK